MKNIDTCLIAKADMSVKAKRGQLVIVIDTDKAEKKPYDFKDKNGKRIQGIKYLVASMGSKWAKAVVENETRLGLVLELTYKPEGYGNKNTVTEAETVAVSL